ncbi:MAG: hypothetical protein K2V38_02820, partial [Gemmataceae bacterium]|nr:hypothetical protein [Gemmataceae bacterium]
MALTDGGVGLEDFVRENFPRVEAVIPDFYHAAERLAKLAAALNVPSPTPVMRLMMFAVKLADTTSIIPSLLKSPRAIAKTAP